MVLTVYLALISRQSLRRTSILVAGTIMTKVSSVYYIVILAIMNPNYITIL